MEPVVVVNAAIFVSTVLRRRTYEKSCFGSLLKAQRRSNEMIAILDFFVSSFKVLL